MSHLTKSFSVDLKKHKKMKEVQYMRYLVVIETQKVKSYLFASPFMRETRGGSVLLDLINRKKTKELLVKFSESDYEEIYLGGGSGRILFKDETFAKQFRDEVFALYRRETINARVSLEVVKRETAKDGNDELFAEWISRGIAETQQNKLGRIESTPILAGRWIRPCSSCGFEPAEKIINEHGQRYLCRACLLKREQVNLLYDKIKPGENHFRTLKSAKILEGKYTKEFIFTTLAEKNRGYKVLLPQDFEDIGKYSKPQNYMGFIYADGNQMGEVIKEIGRKFPDDKEAKQAYKAFSEIVDQATREAAVDSVMENVDIRNEGEKIFLPAEFIMVGGDDLMLAVPAHNALDVAIAFIDKFQEKTKTLQDEYKRGNKLSNHFAKHGITTSAGVVIAHAHYPASDLMDMAGELMKMAKNKAAKFKLEDAGQITGTLDFTVISYAGSESMKDRRKKEYLRDKTITGVDVLLTERPYTTSETHTLLDTIRGLKESNVPRTKLKALYTILFQPPFQAQFDALCIKERLKATGNLKEGSTLYQLVEKLNIFPFRENDDGSWSTPLTEIVELYDFLKPKNRGSLGETGGKT